MKNLSDLGKIITSASGSRRNVLKKLAGSYDYGDFELVVDSVPDDSSRSSFRVRARISLEKAGFPLFVFGTDSREIAARDFLARTFASRA